MTKSNDKKICFIICTNSQQHLEECLLYLSFLEVPEGFVTEVLTIENAKSITAGYNEGMNTSNAKYKVYIHQDALVLEKKLLYNLIDIFEKNEDVGMVGIVGCEKLSKDGLMQHSKRCGNIYCASCTKEDSDIEIIRDGLRSVEAIEGFFMATQYDIPWREDLLDGWDMYDISQSMEFRRVGYKVVVVGQKEPWINHVHGTSIKRDFDLYRRRVLEEYLEITASKNYYRILWMRSEEIGLLGIPYSLQEMGHIVEIPDECFPIRVNDERAIEMVEEWLEEGCFDLVMSYDFSACTAIVCNRLKVPYWAWVYDSPLLELYTDEAKLPYVHISVFDKVQYERLKNLGFYHLFYLPLATEVSFFAGVDITKEDEKKYYADVSFVGTLYDKRGVEELFDEEHRDMLLELDNVIDKCNCTWDGKTTVFGEASDELVNYMNAKEKKEIWEAYKIDRRYFCESMRIVRRCNERERVTMLNAIAEKYELTLYSDRTPKERLHNIKICPWVDYWEEMPKVFYMSKINLNISSRSIESGIPQRVYDILAVGGFCLTNYQPELEEYFEIGKDLVVYHNLDEMLEKIEYYLTHEEARIRIAINGYRKVKKYHTYAVRLADGLGKVFSVYKEP